MLTSANIACGFHAGDPMVMAKTVEPVAELGVVLARISYPDLQGFGRRNMSLTLLRRRTLLSPGRCPQGFCQCNRPALQHVKGHGAIYNAAKRMSP